MRIILTGAVVFVAWAFFSTWLFVDYLRPALEKPLPAVAIPEPTDVAAESPVKVTVPMPEDLVILYGFDKAEFKPDAAIDSWIDSARDWLRENPETVLLITGHTDITGSAGYNYNLGLERARGAFEFLKARGFSESGMELVSKGPGEPAAANTTPEGRAKNRRTVISIKNKS